MNKASKRKALPKFGYKVGIERHCDHSYYSEESYGDWHESYTNRLENFAAHTDEYPDVASIHNIDAGQGALVVWIEWSSGDSFGHGDRNNAEVMGLFRDPESANFLKQQIESWTPNDKAKWDQAKSYHFKTPDGQEFQSGFAPWAGYFDTLESVNIDAVTVFKDAK